MSEFAIAEVPVGKLNALVKNIQKQTGVTDANEAIRLINSGKFIISEAARLSAPTRGWYEHDGVIYISVTSKGVTRSEWIKRLVDAKILRSEREATNLFPTNFDPTSGVTYEIAIFRGALWDKDQRTSSDIRVRADEYGFIKPSYEVGLLIWHEFAGKLNQMGLTRVVVMENPEKIDNWGTDEYLATVRSTNFAREWDCTTGSGTRLPGDPGATNYESEAGFAFVVSKVRIKPL